MGTHPIFESDFDCLTVQFIECLVLKSVNKRQLWIQSRKVTYSKINSMSSVLLVGSTFQRKHLPNICGRMHMKSMQVFDQSAKLDDLSNFSNFCLLSTSHLMIVKMKKNCAKENIFIHC